MRRSHFFTATDVARLMCKKVSLERLLSEKACGAWFGPVTDAMQWGTDREDSALFAFALTKQFLALGDSAKLERDIYGPVQSVGLDTRWIAADTDAIVHNPHGVRAVVEIKCPYSRDAKEVLNDRLHLIQCDVERLCFGMDTAFLVCCSFSDNEQGGQSAKIAVREIKEPIDPQVISFCAWLTNEVHPVLRNQWAAFAALYDN